MSRPRPPKLNKEALADAKTTSNEIDRLKARLMQYEKLLMEGKLPATYIAFEALSALLGGRIEGHSDSELRRAWPESWGNSTMEVPASVLKVLASAWVEYKGALRGVTLGEAFKLEGGSQGRPKMKDQQATRDLHLRLANEVGSLYVAAGVAGGNGEEVQPISLEDACALVAQRHKISAETVRKAYSKYNSETLKGLKKKGILEG